MQQFEFDAADEDGTRRLGAALAHCMPDGTCVALIGTLGAGKTRLVQAVAEACGIDPATVTSPTFVLCQPHAGRRAIYHMDAYRLKDLDEFLELGPDEYFESPGLSMVEWADRVWPAIPDDCLEVHIDVTSRHARRFRLIAHDAARQAALDQVHAILMKGARASRG